MIDEPRVGEDGGVGAAVPAATNDLLRAAAPVVVRELQSTRIRGGDDARDEVGTRFHGHKPILGVPRVRPLVILGQVAVVVVGPFLVRPQRRLREKDLPRETAELIIAS